MIKEETALVRACTANLWWVGLLIFLVLPQSSVAVQFGDVIGEYRGQPIHSNYRGQTGLRTQWGIKWQCVEFVNRFYDQVMGMPNWVWTGNARDYWQNKANVMDRFPNGGAVPPQADDILVWGWEPGRHYGHVAIITAVGDKSVTVAEQNWVPEHDGFRAIPLRGTKLLGRGILGWMRKPGYGPAASE